MENLLSLLKRRNLFGAGDYMTESPEDPSMFRNTLIQNKLETPEIIPPNENSDNDNILSASEQYKKILEQDSGPASKTYRDFLSSGSPREEDFKASKKSKLGAILAGISEGLDKGAAAGIQTKRMVLDRPYNEAVSSYNIQGNRLEKAANLEEKTIANRRNVFNDVMKYNKDVSDEQINRELKNAQISNYQSLKDNRGKSTAGPHYFTSELTGKLMSIDPTGTIKEIGKINETPGEQDKRIVERTGKTSSITEGRQKAIAEFRSKLALSNSQKRALEAAARDANNPNRAFSARALAAREVLSVHPDLADAIDLTTLIIQDKDADDNPIPEATRANMQRLLDAAMQKYLKTATPTSTEKVEMTDKNGKKWMVDPANVEAFKKANQ